MIGSFARGTPRGWRAWLIVYALLALAWPSTGALPWVVVDLADPVVAEAAPIHQHGAEPKKPLHGHAGLPGSPTHPLDHDCAPCQVLKHLARCILADTTTPGAAPPAGSPVVACVAIEPRYASFVAALPPIRGPPLSSA